MADTQAVSRIDTPKWKGKLLIQLCHIALGHRCGEVWHRVTFLHFPHGAVVLEFSATALEILASQYGDIPDDVFVLLSARREIAFRMNAALGRKVPLTTALFVLFQANSHGLCLLPVVRDVCGTADDWGDSRLTRAMNSALLRVKR